MPRCRWRGGYRANSAWLSRGKITSLKFNKYHVRQKECDSTSAKIAYFPDFNTFQSILHPDFRKKSPHKNLETPQIVIKTALQLYQNAIYLSIFHFESYQNTQYDSILKYDKTQPAKYYEHWIASYYHNLNYLGKYYLEFYQTTIYRSKL